MNTDTIAAIATGMTPSGIGIIRVSGEDAFSIASSVFRRKNNKPLTEYEDHKAYFGYIYDNDHVLDEVILLVFKSPYSYTGENIVEIQCHGGILVMNRILELCIDSGARCADPGEFTKRAFLNGRIDLTGAEAVMDLISAKSDLARKNSVSVLNGVLYKKIKSIREEILLSIARIEAALDDPEHMSLDGYEEELNENIKKIQADIDVLIKSYDNGKIIKEGINTAIVGKPNAGKSSILNMFLNEERAIVTEIAGTTRDTLEESVNIGGITLNLIDTAGIRESDDLVEKIGIERSSKAIEKADLVLFVTDSSKDPDSEDDKIISMLGDKKTICLLNKQDLKQEMTVQEIKSHFEDMELKPEFLKISASTGEGKEELIELIKGMFFNGELSFNDEVMVSNLRQKNELIKANEALTKVRESIENSMPEDFLSIDLMSAYASLGEIIGEEVNDDLVDKIFSEFCMGK